MKVRMLHQMSGTRNGEEWPPAGVPVELPTAEAAHYVASGIAERVEDEPETAMAPAAETSEPPAAEVSGAPEPEVRRPRGRPRKQG